MFQFPSNGNVETKKNMDAITDLKFRMFQFPSNGKAETKSYSFIYRAYRNANVSIPFKRESRDKVVVQITLSHPNRQLFPFPSNGKAETKPFGLRVYEKEIRLSFQFPSNGKVHTKPSLKRWSQS